MRKVIADFSPNTASTLNEVQKILLTNGLLTKPIISKSGTTIYISKFMFMNNGIIVETDPVSLNAPELSAFFIYVYIENALPNSPPKFLFTDKDYRYSNLVKVAYFDGNKFIIEDTIDPKEIFKYVRDIENIRGFVSNSPIYCSNDLKLIIPEGELVSRFGKFKINPVFLNLPPLILTVNNTISRISARLLMTKTNDLVFEGINHRFEVANAQRRRAHGVGNTIIKGEPSSMSHAIFITNAQVGANYITLIYNSLSNSLGRDYSHLRWIDLKTIYEKRVFVMDPTSFGKLTIRSYTPTFSSFTLFQMPNSITFQGMIVNPITSIIYVYRYSGTTITLCRITYDSNYNMQYEKQFTINVNEAISSIESVWNDRIIKLYALDNSSILHEIVIDEFDNFEIRQLLKIQTYKAKNSIDGDEYCFFKPFDSNKLIILRNGQNFVELVDSDFANIENILQFEIMNNKIYATLLYIDGTKKLIEIIKTKNNIYFTTKSTNYSLCRSGAMLLEYDETYIYQKEIFSDTSYLPEEIEDNTLAVIYHDVAASSQLDRFRPVVKTNKIDINDDTYDISQFQAKNTSLDLNTVLDELYQNYPNKTIHLRITPGIYIDKSILLRGDTTLEGTFYMNAAKLGTSYVFIQLEEPFSITGSKLTLRADEPYYYILSSSPIPISKHGPNDYFYKPSDLSIKAKIIEHISDYQKLVYAEKWSGSLEAQLHLISNNIKFKNSKFVYITVGVNDISPYINLTHPRMRVTFENCFISHSTIRGNHIKIDNCELAFPFNIDVAYTERLEISRSKTINILNNLIKGNPNYPITIVIENNDLSSLQNASNIFDSSFDFSNPNIQKITIKDNNLQDAHIDDLYSNILIPSPQKGYIREGTLPALFITQQNAFKIVAQDMAQAKTLGTPYYGPEGLQKAINDANPKDTIIIHGEISSSNLYYINLYKSLTFIGDNNGKLFNVRFDRWLDPSETGHKYAIFKNLQIEFDPSLFYTNFFTLECTTPSVGGGFHTIEINNCTTYGCASVVALRTPKDRETSMTIHSILFKHVTFSNSTGLRSNLESTLNLSLGQLVFEDCWLGFNKNGQPQYYAITNNYLKMFASAIVILNRCNTYIHSDVDNFDYILKWICDNNSWKTPIFRIEQSYFWNNGGTNPSQLPFIYINKTGMVIIANSYFETSKALNNFIWVRGGQLVAYGNHFGNNQSTNQYAASIKFEKGFSGKHNVICYGNVSHNKLVHFYQGENVNAIFIGNIVGKSDLYIVEGSGLSGVVNTGNLINAL